jgi:DNA segregation ATPase FtsK/SpoIIIE, S-DNA-T family
MTDSPTDENLYRAAVELVLHERRASTSLLQRIMEVRFRTAKALLERMEHERVITTPDDTGARKIVKEHPAP